MDKQTVLQMLAQERNAYIAFLDLKRSVGDMKEVAEYAQKIINIDEKISVVQTVTVVGNIGPAGGGLQSAQDLIRAEAEAIGKARNRSKAKVAAATSQETQTPTT